VEPVAQLVTLLILVKMIELVKWRSGLHLRGDEGVEKVEPGAQPVRVRVLGSHTESQERAASTWPASHA